MKIFSIFTLVVSGFLIGASIQNDAADDSNVQVKDDSAKVEKPDAPTEVKAASDPKKSDHNDRQESAKEKPTGKTKTNPTALATLQAARDKLINYESVQANILETIAIGRRKFKMTGKYLHGTDLKMRLEFDVEVGGTQGSILEVCDGQVLWTRHRISRIPAEKSGKPPEKPSVRVTRRDVRQILDAAAQSGNVPENMLIADLGLGGLPGLLASLEKTMVFDSQEDISVDDQPLVVISGSWNDDYRSRWHGPNSPSSNGTNQPQGGAVTGDPPAELRPLPDYVPDRVEVYFDKATLFPRRILYKKRPPEKEFLRPMVSLDFVDVEFDKKLNADEFLFVEPDAADTADITEFYLRQFVAEKRESNLDAAVKPQDLKQPPAAK